MFNLFISTTKGMFWNDSTIVHFQPSTMITMAISPTAPTCMPVGGGLISVREDHKMRELSSIATSTASIICVEAITWMENIAVFVGIHGRKDKS